MDFPQLTALDELLTQIAMTDRRSDVVEAAKWSLITLEGDGIVELARILAGSELGRRLNARIMDLYNAVI